MNKKRLLTVMGKSVKTAWSVVFNGTSTLINAGSEASIDNLPDNAFTIEGFINPTTTGATQRLVHKATFNVGIFIYLDSTGKLNTVINCDTADAVMKSPASVITGDFIHFSVMFDDAGDRRISISVDGVVYKAAEAAAGVGAVTDDSGRSLIFGNYATEYYTGGLGWMRVSNSIRYSANFTPPSRYIYPAVDDNTTRLFKMNEGTGTTIVDYSANAQNATATDPTWIKV